jgi:hypothetical protein
LHRAAETAEYLGFERITTTVDLLDDAWMTPREAARRAATLRTLAGKAPPAGTNVLIVTQKPMIIRALGEQLASIRHAEMVIVKPLANGGIRID